MPNSLASARSIFEQNIQKNKAAGCDKTPFGQKTGTSRVVTRRLFAHTKLSDDSNESLNGSSNGEHQRRRSSISSQNSTHSSSSSTAAAIRRKNSQSSQHQPKGQTTVEHSRRSELKPPSLHEREPNYPARSQPPTTTEKISKSFDFKDARQQREKNRGSIKSLADHLGTLDIKSFNRQEGDSNASQSSLQSHRDRVKLPDFRQSSYVRSGTANNRVGYNDSASSLGSSESLDISNSTNSSSFSLSPKPENSLDDSSSSRMQLRRSTQRNATERLCMTGTKSPEAPANRRASTRNNKSLQRHFNSSKSSRISWIRPSAYVLEDDDSCTSSHHSQPFKSVPFTKAVIKRHRDGLKPPVSRKSFSPNNSSHSLQMMASSSNGSRRRSSISKSKSYSPNNSNRSLMDNSSNRSRKSLNDSSQNSDGTSSRRRSSISSKQQTRRPKPPQPDPEELALQEEIEALQRQIQASQGKLAQVQQGEQYDLKRVQETKERKLKRIDTTERKGANSQQPTPLQVAALREDYKQVKATIRQLKQENAKIHNENRKLNVELITTRSSKDMLEESNSETREFIQELKAQQQRQLEEHDQLMHLATNYQKSILDMEEAMEKKNPQRVKAVRMHLEDKIDIVVAFMQKNCSDFAVVEELTILGGFDEEGWEDTDTDDEDYDAEEDARASFLRTSYSNNSKEVVSDNETPRSVADLLIPTSNHSLHLFVE